MSSPSSPKRPRVEEAADEGAFDHGDNEEDTVAGALQEAPDEEGDYLEDQEIVDELGLVQSKLEKVNDEASDRVLAVEQEYNQYRRPIYKERGQLIRKIPGFWLNCFLQHRELAQLVTERAAEVLSYVTELEVDDYPDIKSGYTLSLEFADNPYIVDARIVKAFNFSQDGRCSITGVQLQWKGEDLVEEEMAQESGEGRGYGLMCWLAEARELQLGETDQYADIIKDQLWPNPMRFLTGEGDGGQEEYEEGEEEEEEIVQLEDSEEEEEYGEEADEEQIEEGYEAQEEEYDAEGLEEGDDDQEGQDEEGLDEEGAEQDSQLLAAEEKAAG